MTGSKWIIGLIAFFVVFASTVSGKKLIYKLTALGAYEIHDQIVLTIKLNSDSTFIGTFEDKKIDNVFGWITTEDGPYYKKKKIYFYRYMETGHEHIQFFKGVFSHNDAQMAGTFFYYGNEFGWYAKKE